MRKVKVLRIAIFPECLKNDGVTAEEKKQNFLPFKTESKMHKLELKSKYYWEIKQEEILLTIIWSWWNTYSRKPRPRYKIPIIKFINASQSDIHYVFERYNKEGLTLKPEELRNSAFHNKELIQFAIWTFCRLLW